MDPYLQANQSFDNNAEYHVKLWLIWKSLQQSHNYYPVHGNTEQCKKGSTQENAAMKTA